jgi:hypothetical protein
MYGTIKNLIYYWIYYRKKQMSNFAIYLIGTLFVAGGLAFGAYKLGVSPIWIFSSVIIIIGLGIMAAVSKTRLKEKSDTDK